MPVRVWPVVIIVLLTGCGAGTSASTSTGSADAGDAQARRFAADKTAVTTLNRDVDAWYEARAVWGRKLRPESLRASHPPARRDLRRVQGAFAALRDDAGDVRDRPVRDVAVRLIRRCGQETDVMQRLTRTISSGQDAQAQLVRFGRLTVARADIRLRFEAAVQHAYGANVLP